MENEQNAWRRAIVSVIVMNVVYWSLVLLTNSGGGIPLLLGIFAGPITLAILRYFEDKGRR